MPPKLFLDTMICIEAASGVIPRATWTAACRRIGIEFEYVISPMTLMELFNGIEGGDDDHFHENPARLIPLSDPRRNVRVLSMPGAFMRQTIFGDGVDEVVDPRMLKRCLAAAERAMRRGHLKKGVWIPGLPPRAGFVVDLTAVRERLSQGKRRHVERLERIRTGGHEVPEGRWWAGAMLEDAGRPMTSIAECDRALASCNAAYEFDAELFQEVRGEYRIADRDSDWIDIMQLFYLSDPDMRILTKDGNMMRRIRESPQAPRVLDFDSF